MAEQRYQAVLAVISDGETVTDVAAWSGVARQTMHQWLARYAAGGRHRDSRSLPLVIDHRSCSDWQVTLRRPATVTERFCVQHPLAPQAPARAGAPARRV